MTCLNPAHGVQIQLKDIRAGKSPVVAWIEFHTEVLAAVCCDTACYEGLLAVRTHEGP